MTDLDNREGRIDPEPEFPAPEESAPTPVSEPPVPQEEEAPDETGHVPEEAAETPAELPEGDGEPSVEGGREPGAEEDTPGSPAEEPADETKENAPAPQSPPGLSGIRVAMALCDRVMETVGLERFHGGVRPDNISVRDELVHLGGTLQHGVGEFTPQELEYMSPELFWDGIRLPTGDVYSIGLVLYSIYNYGRLPFWPVSGAITPNARASALQKRMSDELIAPPAKADAELSAVILRALAFRTEERWQDVRELKDALSTCDESSSPVDISLAMSGLLTRPTDASGEHRSPGGKNRTYYDDKEIPAARRPRRRRNLSWLWLLTLGLLIVGAAILLLVNADKNRNPELDPNHPTVAETPTPEPLLTPTPSPSPEPTPEPTERPRGPQYAVYVEDVSWNQAVERCRELGGTLAIPESEEEYNEIVRVCTSARINYVWLGASRQADDNWYTPDGELVSFFNWGAGEPSHIDSGDGVAEDYLLLWRLGDTWVYNDSRENPLQNFYGTYGRSIGFVCKMW